MSLLFKITGIIGNLFQLGRGGPQWKGIPDGGFFNPERIEARSKNDGQLVKVRGATPFDQNDLTPKGYVDALPVPFQYFGFTLGAAPDEITELFGFIDWAFNGHVWAVSTLVSAHDPATNDAKMWHQVGLFKTDGGGVMSQVGATTDVVPPIGDVGAAPWSFTMQAAAGPERVALIFETGPATTVAVNIQARVSICEVF